ncbi:hypothetical protein BCR34DRAFT_585622 [Clohesyomyces aquaticus]|uniref:Transmembrane protein n=1 Tax=Clohesyomyces aquaticus TaxID=1231657 RepID=A0A1Y1ZWK6_9PLEO|nr:hypothetical protein BCR34DRAFT_585622 [Clohesyomyces aquaticus]
MCEPTASTFPPTLLDRDLDRDLDPITLRLRQEGDMDIDGLVDLRRVTSPSTAASTSATPSTRGASSFHEQSKPTSAGTSYPSWGYNGKGKEALKEYSSSASATHGSGSDSERERTQHDELFALGSQFHDETRRTLRGPARSVRLPPAPRQHRSKKPAVNPVVLHQEPHAIASSSEDERPVLKVPRRDGREIKYRRKYRDQSYFATDAARRKQASPSKISKAGLSDARVYTLVALVFATLLTFALCVWAAHFTGKGRMQCTKGIIFAATVLISLLTILAMITARRQLQEALLAALLEASFGITLVMVIHEFM